MSRAAWKLSGAIAGLILSTVLLALTHWDGFFFSWMAAFILAIPCWMDVGAELRSTQGPGRRQRILGVLFGIPQALFGLVTLLIGLTLVGWVLYNSLWTRLPEYSGGLLTFGLGPLMVILGYRWFVSAFKAGDSGQASEKS